MDFCRNVSVSSEFHQQEQVLQSPSLCSYLTTPTSPLDDLFLAQNTEVDVSLEWLSVFVEDCLSSTGSCIPAPTITTNVEDKNGTPKTTSTLQQKLQQRPSSLQKFEIPSKARSKRKRVTNVKTKNILLTNWSYNFPSSDPPLLHQEYWLADSELIMPKTKATTTATTATGAKSGEEEEQVEGSMAVSNNSSGSGQQGRRCSHCLSQKTPQWRAGPRGPKTLCNACGVRYKSGRLLPEYRPAKSPTFVSYLHSNSHKKVMEMRMASSAAT